MTKPLLFTPITIRDVTLKNRVVIAPMATYSAVDGIAQDFHFAHWGRLVLGGAGVRVRRGHRGDRPGPHHQRRPRASGRPRTSRRCKRIAAFMKAQGVVPGIQIAHAGRKGSMQRPWFGNGPLTAEDLARGEKTWDIVAPTAEPMAEGFIVPRQLSVADLATLKGHWVDAAKRALEAGFEVLEIHNAHGYLMHTFLSPICQQAQRRLRRRLRRPHALSPRGGGGRARRMAEGQAAVPARLRRRRPRWRLDHGRHGGLREGAQGARHRRDRLLLRRPVGSATAARVKRSWGFQVPYAERVRREAGVMSMAVGLIVDPFRAEDILQKGQADLIAIAREALVNPCWPQMAEIALGRKAFDAMDDWPVQYGWWLKHRERSIAQIRADEAAARQT